jgi:hypothetical protein
MLSWPVARLRWTHRLDSDSPFALGTAAASRCCVRTLRWQRPFASVTKNLHLTHAHAQIKICILHMHTRTDTHIDRLTYRKMRRVQWACVIYAKREARELAVVEGLLTNADVC